jgi:hypothetical protein
MIGRLFLRGCDKINKVKRENPVKNNTDPSFAGLDLLKKTHLTQIEQFESWAAQNEWERFHYSHYDWWVFPIDQPSAYGFKWVVYEQEITSLLGDPLFMQKYLRGVELVAASWGWHLAARTFVANPQPGQSWHNWPIRLYKAAQSVKLFGLDDAFDSLQDYAQYLINKGESFLYNGRELSGLFK